ncbi:MAG: trypsin-like peptidase domain-containing protein [Sphingomonadales bacterium]
MVRRQEAELGILKSIWIKSEAGVWTIHGTKGLELKPRKGCAKDYFKIENELSLLTEQPGPLGNNLFTSFGSTEFLIRQSIVPVVAWNDGDDEIRCIGTGFFISASGILMTAGHVIRDPIDESYSTLTHIAKNTHRMSEKLRFGVMLPANPAMRNAPLYVPPELREANWFMCPFEWAHHWGREVQSPLLGKKPEFKLDLDIAICKVVEHPLIGPYQPLNIGMHSLQVGDRAVAVGYAEMKNMRLCDSSQPELVVSVGSVTTIHSDNMTEKSNSTPGPNFEFDARIPGKMSGCPILVGGGILTKGVVSRSWEGENLASGCLVAPMMGLPLAKGQTLNDLQKAGTDGICKIVGGGF